jgi:hypothetical protein
LIASPIPEFDFDVVSPTVIPSPVPEFDLEKADCGEQISSIHNLINLDPQMSESDSHKANAGQTNDVS